MLLCARTLWSGLQEAALVSVVGVTKEGGRGEASRDIVGSECSVL